MKQSEHQRKRIVPILLLGLLLGGLLYTTGCTGSGSGKTSYSATASAQKSQEKESEEEESQEEEAGTPVKLLTQTQAKKIAWGALENTKWFFDESAGPLAGLTGPQDLQVGDPYVFESDIDQRPFVLQEKRPGKYLQLRYYTTDDEESDPYLSLCLYVNRQTKEVYLDTGPSEGMFLLPEEKIFLYEPYFFIGLNEENYLLDVLSQQKILPEGNYLTDVSLFYLRKKPGESEKDKGLVYQFDENAIRLSVREESDPDTILGTYEINNTTFAVTDVDSGKVIYRDPCTVYKPRKLTKKTAGAEALRILDHLQLFDLPIQRYQATVTGIRENLEDGAPWSEVQGYEIHITSKNKKDPPPPVQEYILTLDGTALYGVKPNDAEEDYYTFYGNWLEE